MIRIEASPYTLGGMDIIHTGQHLDQVLTVDRDELTEFLTRVKLGDYDHLWSTVDPDAAGPPVAPVGRHRLQGGGLAGAAGLPGLVTGGTPRTPSTSDSGYVTGLCGHPDPVDAIAADAAAIIRAAGAAGLPLPRLVHPAPTVDPALSTPDGGATS